MQKTHQLVDDPNAQFGSTRHSELDKMVDQRIIHAIEEPTYWVSSLTYVSNRDGSIRVCLDPSQLNKELIRPRHQTPTLDDLNDKFANAKFFSKLEAKAGYWLIKLDEESQKLTPLQTPFERYCFIRLPFGISVSQDIFKFEMDRILEKCTRVCGIANNVVVYAETEVEHDRNLVQLIDFFLRISSSHIINSVCWSHALVNGPTSTKPASHGGRCSGQLLMMWSAVCSGSPHSHAEQSASRHFFMDGCTDRPQFAVCLESSSVFGSDRLS